MVLCPRPEAVRIGRSIALVSELRVRDYLALRDYIAARLVSPIAGLDPDADDYPDALRAAYDLAEEPGAWPPPPGSPRGGAVLYSEPEGLAFFLAVACREHPGLDPEALAAELAADPGAIAEVERVAWGLRPSWREAVLRLIDRHLGLPEFEPGGPGAGGEGGGRAVAWESAIAEAADGCPLRMAALLDLTLSQWALLRSGGEPEPEPDILPDDEALAERIQDARYDFFAAGDAAGDEDDDPYGLADLDARLAGRGPGPEPAHPAEPDDDGRDDGDDADADDDAGDRPADG